MNTSQFEGVLADGEKAPTAGVARPAVFISYARADGPFVDRLCDALNDVADVALDRKDIRPSEDWLKRILARIERVGQMIVVISPASSASRICNLEVNHAVRFNKRLIPILRGEVPADSVNKSLRPLQWINCRETDDLATAVSQLSFALTADLPWIDEAARLLARSREWAEAGRPWASTLRGRDLKRAEDWLKSADERTRCPTAEHRELIAASRRATNRIRIGTIAALVALAILAIVAPDQWRRSRIQSRETIDAELRLDRNGSPSALDLGRRTILQRLLERAQAVGHTTAADTIRDRLAQIPSSTDRVEIRGPSDERRGLLSAGVGERLFAWSPVGIDAYGSRAGAHLGSYRQQGGRIVWAAGDPMSDAVQFEVEFDTFADPGRASQVQARQGRHYLKHRAEIDFEEQDLESEVRGRERGFLVTAVDGAAPRLLGLTRAIRRVGKQADRDGRIGDYVFIEGPVDAPPAREHLGELLYRAKADALLRPYAGRLRAGSLTVSPENVRAVPIAYSPPSAAIYEVTYPKGVQRTYFLDSKLGPLFYEVILPVLRIGDQIAALQEPTVFSERAKELSGIPEFDRLRLTDIRPTFSPGALDIARRQAVVRDELVRFPVSGPARRTKLRNVDLNTVINMRFSSGGDSLILYHRDRGASIYSLQSESVVHRFPGPPASARDLSVSADARFVFVLEQNGAITRWNLLAFGPEGWAIEDTTQKRP